MADDRAPSVADFLLDDPSRMTLPEGKLLEALAMIWPDLRGDEFFRGRWIAVELRTVDAWFEQALERPCPYGAQPGVARP